ncbi:endonuclease 8-like 3 isoform X1 [Astyanax mexicanus]|uniref:endonuclease 8-like 3 isoform X1 n=1 Tax=Astyanax mexicanus TaxID=7994 RepID=UPI0020CB36BD|nr:endonuclease 8-like 3 isoform X1 [Astyanax mexicanus]
MVEGPGCTLNGEKIGARVQKGQKVLKVSTVTKNGPAGASLECINGCTYTGVQTLGKELFMYFGHRALRLHFGMNGSMRINPAERRDGKGNPPTLLLQLTKDTICFFDSTVEIRMSEDCEEKVRVMASLDVCSPSFSASRAVEVVCMQHGRMVCDVLLDQAVLPGVGNIIKNEALFNSALNPAVKVNQLTSEQVRHLVKMTRDFTLLFYQCRKRGSSLNQHCKVYKRPGCGQCSGAITVCRLGNDGRMTYFCQRCQTEDPAELDVSKIHGQNTLMGWVNQKNEGSSDHIATKEEEEWTCELCTLINRPISKSCEACLSPRPKVSRDPVQQSLFPSALIRYPCNSFSSPQPDLKMNRRAAFGNTTLVLTDLSQKKPAAQQRNPPAGKLALQNTKRGAVIGTQPAGTQISTQTSPGSPSQPSKRRKTEVGHLPGGASQNNSQHSTSSTQGPAASRPTTPCCPTHQQPSVLRVVNKAGENKGRQFYTCALPQGSQCNYFEWADLHFPVCHHSKRTLMRTVLKLGPNNGRSFYTCSFKQGQQCDFFQWV